MVLVTAALLVQIVMVLALGCTIAVVDSQRTERRGDYETYYEM
jgi:hypothetical protein